MADSAGNQTAKQSLAVVEAINRQIAAHEENIKLVASKFPDKLVRLNVATRTASQARAAATIDNLERQVRALKKRRDDIFLHALRASSEPYEA